jgi:trans-2,3-dihydro-3-hydroxyanthranilate isomerase
MSLKYYVADVFTNELFSGAQIAVFPNADKLTTEEMHKLAREMNLSETVFVSNPTNDKTTRKMRIFSPLKEIDFAGHPVIATAFVLASCGDVNVEEGITRLKFIQNTAELDVNVTVTDGKPTFVQFETAVTAVIDRYAPSDIELAEFLSISPSDIDKAKYSTRLVSCGYPYLVVPLTSYEAVRKAKFNYAAWNKSSAPLTAALEVLVFSQKTPFKDANFNARLLGPHIGIHEDPPVGSAMPSFASYLCSFDFTQLGTHTFAVDRGDATRRRSVLNIEMDHKAQPELSLRIGGVAVLVADGQLYL